MNQVVDEWFQSKPTFAVYRKPKQLGEKMAKVKKAEKKSAPTAQAVPNFDSFL